MQKAFVGFCITKGGGGGQKYLNTALRNTRTFPNQKPLN
jgi:hypothetical protein